MPLQEELLKRQERLRKTFIVLFKIIIESLV
jgi:hypothetical protein